MSTLLPQVTLLQHKNCQPGKLVLILILFKQCQDDGRRKKEKENPFLARAFGQLWKALVASVPCSVRGSRASFSAHFAFCTNLRHLHHVAFEVRLSCEK